MNTLQTVDFHGQPLLTFEKDGTHYVAMKSICENLGLDWEGQRQRIQRDEVLNSTACMIQVVAEDNKMRDMTCLPIEYINGWLFGVDVNRVSPDLREAIILYKKECYQVLNNYWRNNDSETSALLAERVAELEDLVHILLQQRLATPKAPPLSDEDIHALTLQQWQANEDCKQFFLNIEILRVHHQLELNHSRDPEILAINLNQYMAVCDEFSLPNINILKLRRALKLNTRHLFLKATAVRSGVLLDSRGCGILMRCWLFRSKTGARRPRRRVEKMRGDNS